MTHLCVAIFVTDLDQAQRDIAARRRGGRGHGRAADRRVHGPTRSQRSVAACVRPASSPAGRRGKAGSCELPDDERARRCSTPPATGASVHRLELETLPTKPSRCPATSRSRPAHRQQPRLSAAGRIGCTTLRRRLNAAPADVNKIVWTARTIRDNLEAFEILQHRQKPTIALCMGEAGLISRVLAKKFGAFLTFASLDARQRHRAGTGLDPRHEAAVPLGRDQRRTPKSTASSRRRWRTRCRRRSTTPRSTRPATTASTCRCSSTPATRASRRSWRASSPFDGAGPVRPVGHASRTRKTRCGT